MLKNILLRDISVLYATEMILKVNKNLKRNEVEEIVSSVLDRGEAFNHFLQIVRAQGGDSRVVEQAKLFNPYNSINFVADRDGYVGKINSLLLGELIRRLCVDSHDCNIGAVLRVKIGDKVKKGDIIVSFYYKDQADFEKYGLEKSINVSWLNNKNIRLYYIDQDNTCTCIVKINDEIMLQILTNNKEKTLKWTAEDVKKYL